MARGENFLFDVIGDVHGHASALKNLLEAMDYRLESGAFRHRERQAIFVGDYIDRGSEIVETCRIVMAMVAAGSAKAIMGNHEFNWTCLNTPDPDNPGQYLRRHTEKNLLQTKETRAQSAREPEVEDRLLAWMKTLPLWFECERLRVVHAAWNTRAMHALAPLLDSKRALKPEGFVTASRKGNPVHAAREALLNGPEVPLPNGRHYSDPEGIERREARVAWWRTGEPHLKWREAIVPAKNLVAPEGEFSNDDPLAERDADPRPVIFGHYWQKRPLRLFTPRHACVDASVAKQGALAAYRFSGERQLDADNFVYAEVR